MPFGGERLPGEIGPQGHFGRFGGEIQLRRARDQIDQALTRCPQRTCRKRQCDRVRIARAAACHVDFNGADIVQAQKTGDKACRRLLDIGGARQDTVCERGARAIDTARIEAAGDKIGAPRVQELVADSALQRDARRRLRNLGGGLEKGDAQGADVDGEARIARLVVFKRKPQDLDVPGFEPVYVRTIPKKGKG